MNDDKFWLYFWFIIAIALILIAGIIGYYNDIYQQRGVAAQTACIKNVCTGLQNPIEKSFCVNACRKTRN